MRKDLESGESGLIIAISGPPGAGKSTLCRALAERIAAGAPVEYDDYETMTRQSPDAVAAWLARGAPYEELETPGLVDALRAAALAGNVVFETPLGRAHPETGPLIDFSIWLSCPDDVALARKVGQFLEAARGSPPERLISFHDWLADYLDAYVKVVRPAYAPQGERVQPLADLSLDALVPAKEHLSAIISRMESLIREHP